MLRSADVAAGRCCGSPVLRFRCGGHIWWLSPATGKALNMARVTVEDCVVKVPNRFELVLLASQRAREITSGTPLTVERDDDKNPVVALREIAEETVVLEGLRDSLVRGMQKHVEIDEPEETPDLEQTLFGLADPTGPVITDDSTDEEAVEDELEEDLLTVADENDVELSGDDSPEADLGEADLGEADLGEAD